MKRTLCLSVVLLVVLLGCHRKPSVYNPPLQSPDQIGKAIKLLSVTGTVRYIKLAGGFWGIMGDDKKNYVLVNYFPDNLKIEGLRVELVLAVVEQMPSNRMWGTRVILIKHRVIK
ncbi:MAG: hypothetical protein HY454_02445 [Parcubacteria group bacterium]|nr:hypothetical protein [Parcubacteria group bacterium]